jgi:glycosyltransferase involved in cell wall biosynthesis
MKIGINLLYLIPGIVGGTETYAAGLLHGMAANKVEDDFIVFVNREAADWPLPQKANFQRVVCPVFGAAQSKRYYYEQARLPGQLRERHIDLVHSLGYVGPLFPSCPAVVTIHDLNYRWFRNRGLKALVRNLALRAFVRLSARRAQHVIAVSRYTRDEIVSFFRLPQDKVTVVHEAPKVVAPPPLDVALSGDTLQRLGIAPPYFLAFSSLSPNKNIARLVAAYRQAHAAGRIKQALIVVGHKLRDSSGPAEADGLIRYTGYLERDDLQTVLQQAYALLFPSYYEGFGLPVLEAMACGVPVVCSRAASLPEVGGDAALYFDPYSIDDIASKIVEVAQDAELRQSMRTRGYRQVETFSWEKAAQETLAVYRRMLAR